MSLSNVPLIQKRFDRRSKDILDYFISNGWCQNEDTFEFSQCADFLYTRFAKGAIHTDTHTTECKTHDMCLQARHVAHARRLS